MADITSNNSFYSSDNEPSGPSSPKESIPFFLKFLHRIFTFVPLKQGFVFERSIKNKLRDIISQFTIEKETTSSDGSITKYDNYNNILNLCVIIFVGLFTWLILAWQNDYSTPYTISFKWYNFVSTLCLLGALYAWIYAFLKNLQDYRKYKYLFSEAPAYKENILPTLKKLILPFPFISNCNTVDIFIKFGVVLIWYIVSRSLYEACISLHIFTNGIAPRNNLENAINIFCCILVIAGMILNFFSYYTSLVFCYFTRIISTSEIQCEEKYDNPTNSRNLRTLIRISTRISVSFFVVSTLYLVAVSFSIVPLLMRKNLTQAKYLQLHNYGILIIGITLFLCLISYLIVAFLPKIFIYRLFSKWKECRINELEAVLDNYDFIDTINKSAINKEITILAASKLPLEKKELVMGIITILINTIALIINAGMLIANIT